MFYKVLSAEGKSLHGGDLKWSLPKLNKEGEWVAGKWHKVEGDVVVCSNGLHLTTEPGRWYTKGCVCYAAEGKGTADSEGDKTAFRQARLLYPVPHPQWWLDALAFVASIPDTPFMKPDGSPLPEWKLFTAPTLATAGTAARSAAGDAARDAAGTAARSAAGDAARDAAWATARSAAWDAARDAAGDAARDAAGTAAGDAARSAGLYTQVINICSDLNLDEKHVEHAKARWQVWQKGYCLLCDVNGEFYVYAKE